MSAANTEVFIYPPHPDDLELTLILMALWHIACGYPVHVVNMTRGEVTPESIRLGDGRVCYWHGYVHDPVRENFTVPTTEQIGEIRLAEQATSLRALGMFPTNAGTPRNTVTQHSADLPTGFGGSGGVASAAGIATAQNVIQGYVDQYPDSLHFTMSPTDDHPDHAATGQALRNIIAANGGQNGPLSNSRFGVSRLYWDYNDNPDVLAQPGKQWYGSNNAAFLARKPEMDRFIREVIVPIWTSWCPEKDIISVGYHQVINQFKANFAPGVSIGNLTHL
jgi:LmbE family N-acetylglucosaminyl deacetylase